jgi:hypothetical protein
MGRLAVADTKKDEQLSVLVVFYKSMPHYECFARFGKNFFNDLKLPFWEWGY